MNQPKVSVIIPVYNTEKYLRECLDSIVNQTLKDIEIICVDDGSSDGSPCILEEYRAKDSRVVVIKQANSGLSSARNRGMHRAHGEYIAFVDSDDYLELNALEKASQIAIAEDLDIIVFERRMFFDTKKLTQNPPFHYKHITEATEIMSGIQHVMTSKDQGTYCVTVWSALWRRAFLEEHHISFKEGIIHEDHLFSFQAYMAADRVMRIPNKLYHRRVREDSIMTTPKTAKNVIGYFTSAMGVLEYALNHESDPMEAQEIKREYFQMIGAARNIYRAISNEEKEKIWFASELDNREKEADTLRHDLEKQKKRADMLQYDLDCVHDSVSFHVGRAITWAPRKVRGGVQCCRDHGAGYTVRRAIPCGAVGERGKPEL